MAGKKRTAGRSSEHPIGPGTLLWYYTSADAAPQAALVASVASEDAGLYLMVIDAMGTPSNRGPVVFAHEGEKVSGEFCIWPGEEAKAEETEDQGEMLGT